MEDELIQIARAHAERILLANGGELGLLGSNQVYQQVWSRDSMLCGLGLWLTHHPEGRAIHARSLETLRRFQSPLGKIPHNVGMTWISDPALIAHGGALAESLEDSTFMARILPYQVTAEAGETIPFEVEVLNPFAPPREAVIQVVVPPGWEVEEGSQTLEISGTHQLSFKVTSPPSLAVRRARLAVDLTIAGQRFGQQAEALVTVFARGAT
jgi:hypothetical protein